MSNQGFVPSAAKPIAPAAIIAQIPKTRWWMWTPLSLTTLPGHQAKRGLRMIRVLIRMKPKERMNPARTRKMPSRLSPTTSSIQKSERKEATGSTTRV